MRSTINRVGKYDLKAVLARTPTSTVYDGWDSDIARRVAVKMMPLSPADDDDGREALARFKRGAQAAGQLNHPNIVAVYDYGETDDYAYLIMEFIDGPTLKDLFDKNERFGMPEICQIISGLLEALEYSHKHGVVHRDIKPANIMFTQDRKIKVTDFGIARLENSEMTQAGMVIGTPAYMSPEQFLGEKIDLRTDIYSTGVVLYHLLTGERPYEGNLATIMHKVLYGLPPVPSRVSTMVTPALDKVVTRAMARNREDRYSSAAQFNAAVQSTLSPPVEDHTRIAPSAARRLSPAPAPAKSRSGSSARSAIFGLVAVCLAAAGGGAVWYSYSKPTSVRVVEADKNEPGAPKQTASPPEAPISVADHSSPIDSNTRVPPNPIVSLPQSEPEPSAPVASPVSQYSDAGGAPQSPPDPGRSGFSSAPDRPLVPALPMSPTAAANPPRVAKPTITPADRPAAPAVVAKGFGSQPEPARGRSDNKVALANPKIIKPAPDYSEHSGQDDDASASALRRLRAEQGNPQAPPREPVLPTPIYASTSISAVGLVCQTVTPDTAPDLGLDSAQGMVVTGVAVGSAAAKAGFYQDDVILKIAGTPAQNLSVLSKVAAETTAGQAVPVEISRHGKRQVIALPVDQLRH